MRGALATNVIVFLKWLKSSISNIIFHIKNLQPFSKHFFYFFAFSTFCVHRPYFALHFRTLKTCFIIGVSYYDSDLLVCDMQLKLIVLLKKVVNDISVCKNIYTHKPLEYNFNDTGLIADTFIQSRIAF